MSWPKRPMKRMALTRARGKRMMYVPSTPDIAPEAPIAGTVELGSEAICARVAAAPLAM